MGRKRKLMASGNYQRQGVRAFVKSMADRISDLPDGVVHHIISFLAITDLIRFGCVSKRCRQLYLSTPSLDFDVFSDAHMVSRKKSLKLLSSLDRFLWMHRGVNKIQRFRIYWENVSLHDSLGHDFHEDAIFRMMTWIHNAVSCNVEVLEVDIRMFINRQRQPLCPLYVFLCASLRSLFLNMDCTILKAPSLTSSSNLEYLKLRCVCIKDERFFKWISSSCKCIKELHLEYVDGINNVTIESPSLKSFSFVISDGSSVVNGDCHTSISGENLEEIYIDWGFDSTCSKLLNIRAPNLKYLKWFGNLLFHQNLGKLMFLEKAELSLKPKADDFSILYEVLCSIDSTEALLLSKDTTLGGLVPSLLENVHHLSIDIESWLDIMVPQMVSIFGGMHNLSTLKIKSEPLFRDPEADCSGFNTGYWRLQNLPFIPCLKEVTIELSDGSNGIELAAYMLEHVEGLKKMVIVHSPQQSDVIRKIKETKRISNAEVVFQEDKQRGNGK